MPDPMHIPEDYPNMLSSLLTKHKGQTKGTPWGPLHQLTQKISRAESVGCITLLAGILLPRRNDVTNEELKQKLESVANTIRTVLLMERGITPMSKTALHEQVKEIDAMSTKWAYDDDEAS